MALVTAVLMPASPAAGQPETSQTGRPAVATLAFGAEVGLAGRCRVSGREDLLHESGGASPAMGGQFRAEFRLPHHILIGAKVRVISTRLLTERVQWFDGSLLFGGTWLLREADKFPLRFNARLSVGSSIVNSQLAEDLGFGFGVGASTELELGLTERIAVSLEVGGSYQRANLNKGLFEDDFSIAMGLMTSTLSLVVSL